MPKNNLKRNRQLRIDAFIAAQRAGVTDAEKGAAVKLAEYTNSQSVRDGLANYALLSDIQNFARQICRVPATDVAQGIQPEHYKGYEVLDEQERHYQQVQKAYDDLKKSQDKQKELNEKRIKLWTDAGLPALPALPAGAAPDQPLLAPDAYFPAPPADIKDAQKAALAEIGDIHKELFDTFDQTDIDPVTGVAKKVPGLNSRIQEEETVLHQRWTPEYLAKQKALNDECQNLKNALQINSLKAMHSYLPLMAAPIEEIEEFKPEFDINDDKGVTKSREALRKEFKDLFNQQLAQWNLKYEAPKDEGPGAEPVLSAKDENGPKPTPKQIVDLAILQGWDEVEVVEIPPKLAPGETGKVGFLRWFITPDINPVENLTSEFNRRGIPVKVDGTKISPYQKTVNGTLNKLAKGDPAAKPPVPATPPGQPVPFAAVYEALLADDSQNGTSNAGLYLNQLRAKALNQLLEDLSQKDVQKLFEQIDPKRLQRRFHLLGPAIAERMQDIPLESELWAKLAKAGVTGKEPVPAVEKAQKAVEKTEQEFYAAQTAARAAGNVAPAPGVVNPADLEEAAYQKFANAQDELMLAQERAEGIKQLAKYADFYAKRFSDPTLSEGDVAAKRQEASNLVHMLNVVREMPTASQAKVQFPVSQLQLMNTVNEWSQAENARLASNRDRNYDRSLINVEATWAAEDFIKSQPGGAAIVQPQAVQPVGAGPGAVPANHGQQPAPPQRVPVQAAGMQPPEVELVDLRVNQLAAQPVAPAAQQPAVVQPPVDQPAGAGQPRPSAPPAQPGAQPPVAGQQNNQNQQAVPTHSWIKRVQEVHEASERDKAEREANKPSARGLGGGGGREN